MAKRLKQYYGNEVYHIFFHKPEGLTKAANRRYGNQSWEENILYSYSSELAWADEDKKIIYIRNGSRSNSTSTHQSTLRWAVPSEWSIIYINEWNNWSRGWGQAPSVKADFEYHYRKLAENKNQLLKGTKHFGHPNYVDNVIRTVKNYLTTANQLEDFPEFEEYANTYSWSKEDLEMYEIKTWCASKGITGSYSDKVKLFNNKHSADIQKYVLKQSIRKQKLEDSKEARKDAAIKKSIDKWYAGETNSINFQNKKIHWLTPNPVYLRVKPMNFEMVETSKNVTVPVIKCKLLYHKFQQCVKNDTGWKQNGETFTIGYYNVDSISKDYKGSWVLKAGCHHIYQEQIEEFVTKFVPEWKQ